MLAKILEICSDNCKCCIILTDSLFHVADGEVLSWACSQYVGQLIYANVYGVTSAAYVLLTTLGTQLMNRLAMLCSFIPPSARAQYFGNIS